MRILHIDLVGTFNEDWLYQENLMPEYHLKDGHCVIFLATCYEFETNGEIRQIPPVDKRMNNGIRLIRLEYHKILNSFITGKVRKVDGIYRLLEDLLPDIIFLHGPQTLELLTISKYVKKNIGVKLFIDNHSDFSNSATNLLSKIILHKIFYRSIIRRSRLYTRYFYGVIPARVKFLIDVYKTPKNKSKLLLLGTDDDRIASLTNNNIRDAVRVKFGFNEGDFVIITGGKIDSAKEQTLNLAEAVKSIDKTNIKLLIFGSVAYNIKDKLLSFVDNDRIFYLGWINSDEIYANLLASDLAVFPGRHSVLWEQAVGAGLPCIFKYWPDTTHVDLGGNCLFLYRDERDEIKTLIDELTGNRNYYLNMKKIALEKGLLTFSYRKISREAIEQDVP